MLLEIIGRVHLTYRAYSIILLIFSFFVQSIGLEKSFEPVRACGRAASKLEPKTTKIALTS